MRRESIKVDITGHEDESLSVLVAQVREMDTDKALGYFEGSTPDQTEENILWFHFISTRSKR